MFAKVYIINVMPFYLLGSAFATSIALRYIKCEIKLQVNNLIL